MIVKVKLELSISYYYLVSVILILYYLGKQHLVYSLIARYVTITIEPNLVS